MKYRWNIIYYQEIHQQTSPVYDFIESLNDRAQAKLSNTFDLLSIYGVKLGPPHVKKVRETDLWELRILGSDSIRIFYIAATGNEFLLLHGFIKKKQKTDKKEIVIALNRLFKYRKNAI